MSKRGISILLILTAAIALGALALDYRFDTWLRTERAAAVALDADVSRAHASVLALAAAQGAYLADGQDPGDWSGRATKLEDEIAATISGRRSATSDAQAAAQYDAAAEALARVREIDAQIQSTLAQGEKLRAADLVFNASAAAGQRITEAILAAQTVDRQVIDGALTRLGRLRLAMNGVALLFALTVALFFGRHIAVLGERSAPTTAQMLKELPPAVKTGTGATHAAPGGGATSLPAPQPPHAAPATASRPANLLAAAELCVDLARVMDSSDVPALLERTATLLDARGLVIWAVDADGARLRPALSHGYADKVLKKLRPLQIDGDNVTSLAFRSLEPQSMNGASPNDAAAIAIPLVTSTGCVGVMAAELRHNRPHADVLPVAQILGAQFSTLVAAPDEPSRRTAQA